MYLHFQDFAYSSKSRLWEDKLLGMQFFNADHDASIVPVFQTVVAHILMQNAQFSSDTMYGDNTLHHL